MRKRRGAAFAEIVEQARAERREPRPPAIGRQGDAWYDAAGVAYSLIDASLSPARVRRLAAEGATVVFDACGCGGAECRLDWLSDSDVERLLGSREEPVLRLGKNSRADLEQWTSADGRHLVVLAVDVTWGDRIP